MQPFRLPTWPRWYWYSAALMILLVLLDTLISRVSVYSVTQIEVPVGFFFLLMGVIFWASIYYGWMYVRARSPVVLTESGIRQSASGIAPLTETDLGGSPFPPMSLHLVSGGADIGIAIADRDVLLVRKSAIERFGRNVLVVHAPVSVVDGHLLTGLAGHEASLAERAPHSGFTPKSPKSKLLFSLLDSLHGLDSARLREESDFLISKYARIRSEQKEWSFLGSKRFVQELKGLAAAIHKDTSREKLSRFFGLGQRGDDELAREQDKERVD